MTDNIKRFTGRAENYDRYRQRYPTEGILTRLRTWCGLSPSWLIADVGAGTGMLAEVFLENGNRVLAIEPNQEMRDQMRPAVEQQLGRPAPQFEIIDATAEASTLADASIDMVAVGRAFHWFDQNRSLAEFRRILKPGGWVALVAIDRSREHADPDSRDQIAAWENLLLAYSADYERVRSGFCSYENMGNLFPAGEIRQEQLPGTRQLDWPTFHGHAMSLSVVPAPDDSNYEVFQRELRAYFDAYASAGILTLPTTCWITAARFSPQ